MIWGAAVDRAAARAAVIVAFLYEVVKIYANRND